MFGDRKYGIVCLCAYLTLECIFSLTNVRIEYGPMVQSILAGAAGILIYLDK